MPFSSAVEKMTDRMSKFFNSKKKAKPVDPVDEYCKTGKMSDIVKQYAFEVTDFSSQYGSEISISYTAYNLQGQGNIYPSYGDFTQACVFRTYGPWWDNVPSSREPFQRTPPSFCSQDYIEVSFKTKVFPIKLEIYETYNPGCVVRILACERSDDTDVDTGCKLTRWKTLWEGCNTEPGLESRMFCPPLNKCPFPTDLIRLELCHTLVHYYTELDYVQLYGSTVAEQKTAGSSVDKQDHDTDKGVDHMAQISPTCKAMEELSIDSKASSPQKQRTENKEEEKEEEEIDNINTETVDKQKDEENEEVESDNGYFDLVPEEVVQLILSFLDVLSLCRVARTCRLLHQHSYDSLQYTELNLQPHWTQVNDIALDSLQSRSRFLYRLNLSWCHGNIVSNEAFCRYIQACGHNLRCLYLSSCSFLKTESIKEIVTHCPNLTEFDLDSCKKVNSSGLAYIKDLKSLERLNLYRTDVDLQTICNIIRSCPELRILNLGSCNCINAYDDMLIELGRNCKKLISLDLWRSKTVSHIGILALAEGCPKLQELDIGWCPDIKSTNNCIIRLVEQCPGLKKLYLTANRTVCTADLEAIAKYCRDLEQLDILGTRQVSAEAALEILRKCEKLLFFDVSFCSGINKYDVDIWTKEFPNVSIKKSFQN